MGHLAGKDLFRTLGKKIDGLATRAPWNDTLREILERLYGIEEAQVVVRMPDGLSSIPRIAAATGVPEQRLRPLLEGLAERGLLMDLELEGETRYLPSPMVIGIFEFTMMRTGPGGRAAELAPLFHRYLVEEPDFLAANFGDRQRVSVMRALPHAEAVEPYLEVLDHERAEEIVAAAGTCAVGTCSCRHEKMHLGHAACRTPLETCTSFGFAADYLIRHGLARHIERHEMLDIFRRSRDLGLVLCADNVRRNVTFVCHCCGCCCTALLGLRRHGYENSVVSSTLVPRIGDGCTGCGRCIAACPVEALATVQGRGVPRLEENRCLGCGVCPLPCPTAACRLDRSVRRVIHPDTTFEKILLQCLERGTLQNQLFDDQSRLSHRFMRGFVGGFLRLPPVQRALMSEMLRSRFLAFLRKSAAAAGHGAAVDL